MYNKYPYTDFHELNLDWFLSEFKQLKEEWETTSGQWDQMQLDFQTLEGTVQTFTTFVENYFENLDVQDEINNKLDALVADGTLSTLLAPLVDDKLPGVVDDKLGAVVTDQLPDVVTDQLPGVVSDQIGDAVAPEVPAAVTSWLKDNVDPVGSAVTIDTSLTIAGSAADAKVVGDNFQECYKPEVEQLISDIEQGYYSSGAESIIDNPKYGSASESVEVADDSILKIADTDFDYVIYWYDYGQSKFITNSIKHNADYDLSILATNPDYTYNGKIKLKFMFVKHDDTDYTYTGMKVFEIVSCKGINYLDGKYIKDNSISGEKIEQGVIPSIDGTYSEEETTGTYDHMFDFYKGQTYKFTLVENNSSNPKISFQGIVSLSPETLKWGFQLSQGESAIFVPQQDYIGVRWVSVGGSVKVRIYNNDGELKAVPHIFYCGPDRTYTKLIDAVKAAEEFIDSILYVDEGVYDLVSEFGDDYFNNILATDTLKGVMLMNGIHVIFAPNSKVVCDYQGSNANARKIFSPFNVGQMGFTIENLDLECANVRYCVHDDRAGGTESCKSVYKNCKMIIDNSNNTDWPNGTCIGGGLGSNHLVVIENCVFDCNANEGWEGSGIYYHQSNNLSNPDHCCKMIITGNYLINGLIYLDFTRTDATNDTEVLIEGNSWYKYSYAGNDGIYPSTITANHVNVRAWNNDLRTPI